MPRDNEAADLTCVGLDLQTGDTRECAPQHECSCENLHAPLALCDIWRLLRRAEQLREAGYLRQRRKRITGVKFALPDLPGQGVARRGSYLLND